MLEQQDVYIPQDERTLRYVQRRVPQLERQVRAWTESVLAVLPKGLGLLDDELYILSLYLTQQRRLNLELDARNGEESLRSRLARAIPFLYQQEEDPDIFQAVHRMVATRIECDIERATDFFCRDHNLPGLSDPVIDWRVAIRYLAQQVHRLTTCQEGPKTAQALALNRFELTLTARELAAEVVDKRHRMFALSSTLVRPA